MRYFMTLKNALNHFVNTTEEKQNLQRIALLVLASLQLRWRTPLPPHRHPLFLIGVCLAQSLTWDTSPQDWSCRCEAHTPNIIRLTAPGEIRQGRKGREVHVFASVQKHTCERFSSSINLNATEWPRPIKIPLQDHSLVSLRAELCLGQGEEEAGERMVKDSYAID